MLTGYKIASLIVALLFAGVLYASYTGMGLSTDAQALARAKQRSVRTGSLHTRTFYGGGPGFGK